MGFLRWIMGFVLAVYMTAFAVFNTHDITVYVSPAHPAYTLPLYAIGIGGIGLGFLIGAFSVWFNTADIRKEKRQQRKTIRKLEHDLEDMSEAARTKSPPSDFFPAITHTKATTK